MCVKKQQGNEPDKIQSLTPVLRLGTGSLMLRAPQRSVINTLHHLFVRAKDENE